MFKTIATALTIGLLASTTSFAADAQMLEQVKSDLAEKGMMIDIPEDVTDEQLGQLLAVLQGSSSDMTQTEAEVKKILGME